jgi:putative membrane protein
MMDRQKDPVLIGSPAGQWNWLDDKEDRRVKQEENPSTRLHPAWFLVAIVPVFIWSAINPHDRFTWFLEVAPVLIGAPLLVLTYRHFPLTTFAYTMLALHAIILIIGGHYTYAEVPLFDWIRDAWGLARNHYDRLGHFAQGFIPAVIAREILLRVTPLQRGGWLRFLVVCICLALSASYELIEWGVAEGTGSAADAFLGTQGDPWDTQWDMALALTGALTSLALTERIHDRFLVRLEPTTRRKG